MAVSKKDRVRGTPRDGAEHLGRLGRRAALALFWERLWPRLVLVGCIVGVFHAVSWLGFWLDLPAAARIVGTCLFGLATAAAVAGCVLTPHPSRGEILRRLDRDAGSPHRPATALSDELANGGDDPSTLALWHLHRRRLEAAVRRLVVAPPSPRVERRDRFALRAAVMVAAAAAAFVAGPEKYARVAAAFDWRGDASPVTHYRLDAWIDPPAYTSRPPKILPVSLKAPQSVPPSVAVPLRVEVPVGSAVVVRMSVGLDVAPVTGGKLFVVATANKPGLAEKPQAAHGTAAAPEREFRWILRGDSKLTFQEGSQALAAYDLVAIADQPPSIALTDTPVGNARGSLTLAYRTKDDYGVTAAEATFGKPTLRGSAVPTRSLAAPPKAALTLPPAAGGVGDGRTTIDLSDHPWAGSTVTMTLTAHDEGGNLGESAPVQVTLPQRPFLKPLARALVEQRRNLVLTPDDRSHVGAALEALMIGPDEFTPEASIYLGLRSAWSRLDNAKNDDDLRGVADLLWEMALRIEDGDLSDAERQLRAAEQQLREAMQRGASDAEIKKLTDELRGALERFLGEMAQKAQKQPQNAQKNGRPRRTITPEDLKAMMDRMADAARNGNMADAQQMLDQLQSVLENLKTARGRGDNDDPTAREMSKSLNELDQMTRDQQELRDKTFRQGQKQRNADRSRPGAQEQSDTGGQQGGDEQANNDDGNADEQGREDRPGGDQAPNKDLQGRQEALRKQLGELEKRLKENGIEGEKGLDAAEQAMKDAGRMLSEGRDGKAVDAQGRALEGLRRGAQGLAQKLEQGNGAGQTEGEREGSGQASGRERGRAGRDPLDRPSPNDRDAFRGGLLSGGPGAAQRAQQVLQELRRRLSDPQRPATELDYFERLLRRY